MIAKHKKKQVTLDLSLRVYPLDAVLGACYRFIDDFYIYLDHPAPRRITVCLLPKNDLDEPTLQSLAGSFSNELLHELLRVRIGKKTGAVREMIVGRALLSAEPLEPHEGNLSPSEIEEAAPSSEMDYLDDPLGIAVPWEEKFSRAEDQEGQDKADEDRGGPQ